MTSFSKTFIIVRPGLQVILLTIFLHFFGLPALQNYREMKVMVISSRKDTGGIQGPAITLSARNPHTKIGWRNNIRGYNIIESTCKNFTAIEECITKNTFNQSDVFKDVLLGVKTKKSILTQNLWSEDFTVTWAGRTYTLDIPHRIGPNDKVDQLFITFDYEHIKRIYIHDPNFFIQNSNPIGLPSSIYVAQIDPNKSANHYHRLALTEVQELNLAEDPCEESQHYSFQVSMRAAVETPRGRIEKLSLRAKARLLNQGGAATKVLQSRVCPSGQFFQTALRIYNNCLYCHNPKA